MSAEGTCSVVLGEVTLTEVLSSLPMVAAILDYDRRGRFEQVTTSFTHVLHANLFTETYQ